LIYLRQDIRYGNTRIAHLLGCATLTVFGGILYPFLQLS